MNRDLKASGMLIAIASVIILLGVISAVAIALGIKL